MTSSANSDRDDVDDVAGIDPKPVTAWMAERVELSPPLHVRDHRRRPLEPDLPGL